MAAENDQNNGKSLAKTFVRGLQEGDRRYDVNDNNNDAVSGPFLACFANLWHHLRYSLKVFSLRSKWRGRGGQRIQKWSQISGGDKCFYCQRAIFDPLASPLQSSVAQHIAFFLPNSSRLEVNNSFLHLACFYLIP